MSSHHTGKEVYSNPSLSICPLRSHHVTWQSLEGRSWIVTGFSGPALVLCRCWFDDFVCKRKREIMALVDSHMFFPVSYRNVAGGAEFFRLERLIGGSGDKVGEVNGTTAGAILTDNRVFV